MRNLFILLLCLSLFPAQILAKTIYHWTDEQGVEHFSDQPTPLSQRRIHRPDPPQVSTQALPNPLRPSPIASQHESSKLTITIKAPTQEQTIRSNSGQLSIMVALNRSLKLDEKLQLMMNNQPINQPQTASHWHLNNVSRGTHKLEVQAFQHGKLIALSQPITVHLLRVTANTVK
ncbi:DUF4124 domain-containing protein [Vibrio salilacus]|uniref:DUF4124 domain-containing protein n=1 Tax=Vibrio salilacus TaxID=1323749 RepID=UPI000C29C83F|nr:DUF4124 domain-containing protein [Vibrio salilacus]